MKDKLHYYIQRLTTHTARSASVRLLRLSPRRFLDLHAFDLLHEGRRSFDILRDLLAGEKHILLCERAREKDSDVNKVSNQLRKIATEARMLFEERGTRDLHIGWPIIEGQLSDGRMVRTPLMFFGVQLVATAKHWALTIQMSDVVNFNLSFLLNYFASHGIAFDEARRQRLRPPELPQEARPFLTALYRLLDAEGLSISFGSKQFEERLESMPSLRGEDLASQIRLGHLFLRTQAVLGIFSQANAMLIADYMSLMDKASPKDFVPDTSGAPAPIAASCTPFQMDGSQEYAFERVRKGDSLVVQGPPGTGKSQLIANLLADGMMQGKRVLLVSQKLAALDVIRERLKHQGLSEYVAQVSDLRNDRSALYKQLASRIASLQEEVYAVEQNTEQELSRIQQLHEKLEEASKQWQDLRASLYDDKACGLSIKQLYLSSDSKKIAPELSLDLLDLHWTALHDLCEKLRGVCRYKQIFSPTHLWAERCSFASYDASALQSIRSALAKAAEMLLTIEKESKTFFDAPLSLVRLRRLIKPWQALKELSTQDAQALSTQEATWLKDPKGIRKSFEAVKEQIKELFTDIPPEDLLQPTHVAALHACLPRWLVWSRYPWLFTLYRLLAKGRKQVAEACACHGLPMDYEGLAKLYVMLSKREKLEKLHENLRQAEWPDGLPLSSTPTKDVSADVSTDVSTDASTDVSTARHLWQAWVEKHENALQRLEAYEATPLHALGFRATDQSIATLLKWLSPFKDQLELSDVYLHEAQYKALKETGLGPLKEQLDADFDDLCALDELLDSLETKEKKSFEALHTLMGNWDAKAHEEVLRNAWALAWIDELERRTPLLRSVSRKSFDEERKELMAMQIEKEQLSSSCLQKVLRERLLSSYEEETKKQPLNHAYGLLKKKLERKRRIPHLRELFAHHDQELFALSSCWLAIPQAASAIFPLEKIFDIVLFDEASQSFLEDGLSIIYRSKQVVVMGDKHQLKPNDLFANRWIDDEIEDSYQDQDNVADSIFSKEGESLLDWAATRFHSVMLNWHYRSQSLELINFSNKHFYEGQLFMIPSRDVFEQKKPAISYCKVEGRWQDNVNVVEANYVLDLVRRLAEEDPQSSIGVVTFNNPQQEYIQECIESYRATYPNQGEVEAWERLFVKNIENVQGDERDIIIFSIAYAPGIEKEASLRLYFGSLSQQGGENRLNVAVSRARKHLYVVSSIWPEEMNARRIQSPGGRLLRAYLHYALEASKGKHAYDPMKQAMSSLQKEKRLGAFLEQLLSSVRSDDKVPFADLTTSRQDILLYTDDGFYAKDPLAKSFYLHRPRLLAEKGWPYLDSHSRAYWRDPEQLREALEAALRAIQG